jgi:ribosomal protein S8E
MTRSEIVALVTAIGLHAGGLAVARLAPGVNLLAREHTHSVELTEVDVSEAPRRKEEPAERAADAHQAANVPPELRKERTDPSARPIEPGGTNDPGAESPTSQGPVLTAPDGEGSDWTAPPGEGWLPPGLGPLGPVYLTPEFLAQSKAGPAAPTRAPEAKKVDRGVAKKILDATLRGEDKKLGLDLPAAGTVASLFRAAVLASDAPATARAQFQVALGPGGVVKSVKVLSASAGKESSWQTIAATVKAQLASQKLALTGRYAKGAVIVVDVKSKMQMPSGAEVDAGIELSLTQKFDLSDIGAKPKRVVSTSHSASPVE